MIDAAATSGMPLVAIMGIVAVSTVAIVALALRGRLRLRWNRSELDVANTENQAGKRGAK